MISSAWKELAEASYRVASWVIIGEERSSCTWPEARLQHVAPSLFLTIKRTKMCQDQRRQSELLERGLESCI
jgi:hypothetical protein